MQTAAGLPATNLPLSEVKRWADELAEWVTELASAPAEDGPVEGVADPDEEQQAATAAMEARSAADFEDHTLDDAREEYEHDKAPEEA